MVVAASVSGPKVPAITLHAFFWPSRKDVPREAFATKYCNTTHRDSPSSRVGCDLVCSVADMVAVAGDRDQTAFRRSATLTSARRASTTTVTPGRNRAGDTPGRT